MIFDAWWKRATVRRFASLQKKILFLRGKNSQLSDAQLQEKIIHLKQKIEKSQNCDKYLVSAFALTREVIYRKTGLLLFPTQIFGGIVLHYGNIAQMNTGEGKTLTAILPICLNALTGEPVYVITVNEYLAQRDWNLGKPIFDFFGLSSGFNSTHYNAQEKKELYEKCKIIYTTASEIGFDYLRNNLVTRVEDKIDLRFIYTITDEIDSIKIDEAQNPLIISQRWEGSETSQEKYNKSNHLANSLIPEEDYRVNEKDQQLWLFNKGIKKIEKFYQITNLFSFVNQEINFLLHNSLKAKHFYRNGVDYIVDHERKKIVIIDALTGRLVPNRVYSAGLQQAVESKEGLSISPRNKSTAVITYQNFFRLFKKISGMTGTAKTEAEEFRQVYGMEVMVVRPHKKLIRQDKNDLLFLNKESKYQAITKRVKEIKITTQQPVLLGSPNLDVSEYLSSLWMKEGIAHSKLNAINHQEEAKVIAQAGKLGEATISTNMAGRGTDIIPTKDSRKSGGLLVLGVERNTSRRIDNQLRGRSARQGDPGESQFYLSLEDDLIKNCGLEEQLIRFFGQKKLKALFARGPLQSKWINIMVAEAQEMLRNVHAAGRQYTLNYDLLIHHQRRKIYQYRDKILTSPNVFAIVLSKQKEKSSISSFQFSQEKQLHLKSQLVREIDFAWANYLEALERVNHLIQVKSWLPQDPQEAFFWETSELFRITFQHVQKKMKEILSNSLT